MSDAVAVTCPRCGAGVEHALNAVQAQCRYCGTIVELPRVEAPRPVVEVVIERPVRPKRGCLATYGAVFLLFGFVGAVSLASILASAWRTTPTSMLAQLTAAPAPDVPRGDVTRLSAPNLKAVDATSLVQQAAAAVRQRDAQCELTYAYIGMINGGGLDATGSASLLRFSCHSVDRRKPPGQDVSDNEWDVRVLHGYLTLEKSAYGSHNKQPWREPTCPFSQAWAAAVASGVPANAQASVYYEDTAWSLSVNGHPEYARKINGATCRVVRER